MAHRSITAGQILWSMQSTTAVILCRPEKEEFERVYHEMRTAETEHEAELRHGETHLPAEVNDWGGLPEAWHTLGWNPADSGALERVSAWLSAHRQGLPSISFQPVSKHIKR